MKVEHSGGVKAMTDEQLEAGIEAIQRMLEARAAGDQARVVEGVADPAALPAPPRKAKRRCGSPIRLWVSLWARMPKAEIHECIDVRKLDHPRRADPGPEAPKEALLPTCKRRIGSSVSTRKI
jgi:hypothetical protein